MKTEKIIDYAYPCMMAENELKALHHSALMNDWDEALRSAKKVASWATEIAAAIAVMQHKDEQ